MAEKSHPEAETQVEAEGLTQAKKSENPIYEVGFHIVPTVTEDGVGAVVERVRKILDTAEILSEQYPSKMSLAYMVERASQGKREKYTESYFGFIKFSATREHAAEIGAALRALREILRFILVETIREDAPASRRAVFTSSRLEGETIQKPHAAPEKPTVVSEEELDKSIDALVN
jgi:ribosomal protein S6